MPSGYVCSNCGAPVSPAQNRCHECGAEIDWEKAVGRVSYIDYIPNARRRRRRRRLALLSGLLLVVIFGGVFYWGWQSDWVPAEWQFWQGSSAYQNYWQQLQQLQGAAAVSETPSPAAAAILTPVAAISPTPTVTTLPAVPTNASEPPPTLPAPSSTPTPLPDDVTRARALVEQARAVVSADPCRAAELLQQAIDLADTPGIEALRQDATVSCAHLTATPSAQLLSPLPSPAPQRIAFTTYDMALARYGIRTWRLGDYLPEPELAADAMQPAFGPAGVIAYRSLFSDAPGVYLQRTDGGVRRLTKGVDDSWPRWGPDGRQIIFTSATRSPDGSPHIYLVDVATRAVEDLGPGQHADWSHAGAIILQDCTLDGASCGLWRMDPLTLQRRQLTNIPDDSNPVWSPDGRFVAFMSSGRSGSWDVFVLDLESDDIIPVSPDPAEDGLPVWSPDGGSVAFLSNRNGDWAIYVWRLQSLETDRLLPVAQVLPNWDQAGLDWGQ